MHMSKCAIQGCNHNPLSKTARQQAGDIAMIAPANKESTKVAKREVYPRRVSPALLRLVATTSTSIASISTTEQIQTATPRLALRRRERYHTLSGLNPQTAVFMLLMKRVMRRCPTLGGPGGTYTGYGTWVDAGRGAAGEGTRTIDISPPNAPKTQPGKTEP